jgi:uncharacterized protein (TIGR00730 family)
MERARSICLYAASSNRIGSTYFDLAERFGRTCAAHGYRMVFGGGKIGLMGAAARACRAAGGSTLGVIPGFLRQVEIADEDGPLVEVTTMHERKHRMFVESDAFVSLPGGIGTLEEAIETLSWRRLELHAKPIVFLAEDDFWAPLFTLLHHTVREGFTAADILQECIDTRSVEACFEQIETRLKVT